jgi:hypothetical protein
MVKTSPGASLEVIKTYFFLQLLVVTFDAPTEFNQADQFALARRGRKIADVIAVFTFRWSPLTDEPQLVGRLAPFGMALGKMHPLKARVGRRFARRSQARSRTLTELSQARQFFANAPVQPTAARGALA